MAVKHLSEDQIQDFLDGNSPTSKNLVERHIRACPACKKIYGHYQNLFVGLKQDPGFQLSPDFASSVISRLPQAAQAKVRFQLSDIFIGITGIAALIGALIYFIDINIFSDLITKIRSLASLGKSLTASDGGLMVLGLAGLTLLFTAALDWLLVEPKSRKLV
ncbi:MAG: hypothetical protein A2145_04490 [candidate division Zixibacteria bacterium RBG_16_40_9]|nr:MAG: hypothetical protein A2145_04490 [candidate division Zixibacteria bacterium RBG_16_40_9]